MGLWYAAFSTQTCSVCKSRAGPKGRKDLGIRGWQCTVCGAVHDRNVNAAHNILAAGHRRLVEGILGPCGRGGCQAQSFGLSSTGKARPDCESGLLQHPRDITRKGARQGSP
jgi:hypothetical protein